MDQGASTSLNPNEDDIPGYGSTTPGPSREDQQVMGAQSTATTARSTMLNGTGTSHGVSGPWDMDGEVIAASAAQVGEAVGEEEAQASTEDQRAEETTGRDGPAQTKASRVGALLTEVSSAVQGVVKASTAFRPFPKEAARGPGSAGTERTARTSGSGYVTATSEGDAVDLAGRGGASFPGGSERLFSSEQAMRLENMAKAAPLIYPEAQAVPPELPHSVSSDSGEAIQSEVRRQLQQFMHVQSDLERRMVLLQQENELLRRGVGLQGAGVDSGVRGWLGGLSRGLMGLVQPKFGQPGAPMAGVPPPTLQVDGGTVAPWSANPLEVPTLALSPSPGVFNGTPTPALSQGAHIAGQVTGPVQAQPQVPSTGQVTGPVQAQPQVPFAGQVTGQAQPQVPFSGQVTGQAQPQVPFAGQVTGQAQPQVPFSGQVTGQAQPQVPFAGHRCLSKVRSQARRSHRCFP